MGYCANSRSSNFLITSNNKEKIIDAIKDLDDVGVSEDFDVYDLFRLYGFSIDENGNGDIDDLWFDADKYHDDDVKYLFGIIAPFVQEGSYVTFQGEDDSLWAFYFNGVGFEEFAGEVVFPGMPLDGPRRLKTVGS